MAAFENKYMRSAVDEARSALGHGDIPVGAVIVRKNAIIARAHNTREAENNPLGHAEINAIKKACDRLKNWRLDDCDLYVTLEPCLMCTGAIIESRLRRVYFGAYDTERGYIASNDALKPRIKFEYYCGIMEDECKAVLDEFFKNLRL